MAESSNPNPNTQPPVPPPWLGGMILSTLRELNPTLDFSTPTEIGMFVHQDTQTISVIQGQENIQFLHNRVMIDSLPVVEVKEPGTDCAICLSEIPVNGTEAVKELPCGHRFHSGCIERWLGDHSTCPLCRDPVQKNDGGETSGWNIHVFFQDMSNGSSSGLGSGSGTGSTGSGSEVDVDVGGGEEDGGGGEVD